MSERLDELAKRREAALHAGSERSVERQHAKGKLLARERVEYLLDDGSFHELDQLVPGDLIEVETAIGAHTYAVRESVIVRPTELWVIQDRPGAWLTLTTCHPKFSSRQRLIVFAELIDGPNARVIVG